MTKSFFQICGSQVTVTYKVNGKEEYDQWSLACSGCHRFLRAYLKPHSWLCAPGTAAFYQGIVLFLPPSTYSVHILFLLFGMQSLLLFTWCNPTPCTDFIYFIKNCPATTPSQVFHITLSFKIVIFVNIFSCHYLINISLLYKIWITEYICFCSC